MPRPERGVRQLRNRLLLQMSRRLLRQWNCMLAKWYVRNALCVHYLLWHLCFLIRFKKRRSFVENITDFRAS